MNEFYCDICGELIKPEDGFELYCEKCQPSTDDWPQADDPEDVDYELQGSI